MKAEISELKVQLKTSISNGGVIPNSMNHRESYGNPELDKSKEDLTNHFIEEVRLKKRIFELEQKMESANMNTNSKRNELQ